MARYIGPKTKIARKFGVAIYGDDKSFEKRRNQPPGQHGPNKRRGAKKSEYAVQLAEKQKVKYIYGILEKQFANMFDKAHRSKGVYRLGFAKTRAAARQLVSHRHITVNGELVNIPSYSLKAGDVVAVRAKSKSLEVVADALASKSNYEWLQYNDEKKEGVFISTPERLQIPEDIKEQLIVELYSK